MDDFYRENILDHFKNPRNFGRIKNPDAQLVENNPFCGDKIGMGIKLKIKNSKFKAIKDIKFFGEGCAISMASASMLTEEVKNKSWANIIKLDRDYILKLLGIELTPTRLKCALLPLEVLHKVVNFVKNK